MGLSGTGRFAKQFQGKGYFAEVRVEIKSLVDPVKVEIETDGGGFLGQGYIESLSAKGYEDWKLGAFIGGRYALEIMNREDLVIKVKGIEGLTSDTNPTIIAAATAQAVWNALGFQPSSKTQQQVITTTLAKLRPDKHKWLFNMATIATCWGQFPSDLRSAYYPKDRWEVLSWSFPATVVLDFANFEVQP